VNCREAFAKLYEYLDKELGEDDKRQLEQHLEFCSDCLKKYELEEEFNKVIKQKICCQPDVTHLKNRVREQIDKIDASSQPRNILFLLMPLLAAAIIMLVILIPSGRGSDPQAVLLAMRPFADEHGKCLQHIIKYDVESTNPAVVKAGLEQFRDLPEELFAATPVDVSIQAGAVAHLPSGDDAQFQYEAYGEDVSVFVLPRDTVDKSPLKKIERNGKAYYVGSCPFYQYVVWTCGAHECVAVSKLTQSRLVDFALIF
jgi:mycothiol system anti-sigma-R factor